jgi:uncharacterized protein
MTRRLTIEWPDARPFKGRDGTPIRILAVSDQFETTLTDARNREAVGQVDLILGCGDLDCDELAFLADGFNAPIQYVLGNHDAPARWEACRDFCPEAIQSTSTRHEAGISIVGLTWPGKRGPRSSRSERLAWGQVLRLAIRRLGRSSPVIVISHVPPRDAGDVPTAGYHRGFSAYRWLLGRLQPPLWLHGHTPMAATTEWQIQVGPTTVVNVTGAVVVELWAPGSRPAETASDAEPVVVATDRPERERPRVGTGANPD